MQRWAPSCTPGPAAWEEQPPVCGAAQRLKPGPFPHGSNGGEMGLGYSYPSTHRATGVETTSQCRQLHTGCVRELELWCEPVPICNSGMSPILVPSNIARRGKEAEF